jgi:hypothetical protein
MANDRSSYTRGIMGCDDDCEPAILIDNKNIHNIDALKNGSTIALISYMIRDIFVELGKPLTQMIRKLVKMDNS